MSLSITNILRYLVVRERGGLVFSLLHGLGERIRPPQVCEPVNSKRLGLIVEAVGVVVFYFAVAYLGRFVIQMKGLRLFFELLFQQVYPIPY